MRWPPVLALEAKCVNRCGMAVDAARSLVVVTGRSDSEKQLYVYSLGDGSLLRSFDSGVPGYCQGLCITPRGTLLVAESYGTRLLELDVSDGKRVQNIGVGVLSCPAFVDCNDSAIAVTERPLFYSSRVKLLSWPDGILMAQISKKAIPKGMDPYGLRLLSGGGGVAVADNENKRICIFSTTGVLVRAIPVPDVGTTLWDVTECDGGANLLVVGDRLCKVSAATGEIVPGTEPQPYDGAALALVSGDGDTDSTYVVVRNREAFSVCRC